MKSTEKNRAVIAEAVARAWKDDSFRSQLKADPAGTLRAGGAEIPAGTTVKVLENTDTVFNSVLPPKGSEADSQPKIDAALKKISNLDEGKEIRIVRDSATTSHIVIPASPVASASGKLSDQQLEHVAGGKGTESTQTNTTVQAEAEVAEAAAVEVAVAVAVVVVPCAVS